MSTQFYIKKDDTNPELRVVMKKRQPPVDGVTPPDALWVSSQTITNVYFSMAKIPQLLADGTTLYPDGTIHREDGTILNPLNNDSVLLSGITLLPGELLNQDFSVTQTDGSTRFPNGLISKEDHALIPSNSYLLPNGMIALPPTTPYPQGYIYNPNDQDRTNYYQVGNPTENPRTPENKILIPDHSYLDSSFSLIVPPKILSLPEGTTILSTNTVQFPAGSTKEESTSINRDNAIVLPNITTTYPSIYSVTYSSSTRRYSFPSGSNLVYNDTTQSAHVVFPNASQMEVPYESVKFSETEYIFPYGTTHLFASNTFIFPGKIITLPLSATINVLGPSVSVTFDTESQIIQTTPIIQIQLAESNLLSLNGNVLLYDGSTVSLNTNHIILYNGFEIFPRGTQKNALGTIIHPEGYIEEGSYIRYYPTKSAPSGILIRPTDASIVNNDGTFTKLNNSIVDSNGRVIQEPNTQVSFFEATVTPPFIPAPSPSTIITINKSTASFQTIQYMINTQSNQATLLKYQWRPDDTAHVGLYSGEFEIHFDNDTKRTFPILSDDSLFIQVLDHFSN